MRSGAIASNAAPMPFGDDRSSIVRSGARTIPIAESGTRRAPPPPAPRPPRHAAPPPHPPKPPRPRHILQQRRRRITLRKRRLCYPPIDSNRRVVPPDGECVGRAVNLIALVEKIGRF